MKGKLWTYTNPNNTKAQLDFILIKKKLINSALNYETFFYSEGISSDHRIVTVKIFVRG